MGFRLPGASLIVSASSGGCDGTGVLVISVAMAYGFPVASDARLWPKLLSLGLLALIACSNHKAVSNTGQASPISSSVDDLDAGKCVSEQEPTAVDGGLPSWCVGFFHAVMPDVADAVNLRLGPEADFEWALTGCDTFDGQVGSAVFAADEVLLQPGDGRTSLMWPDSIEEFIVHITMRPGGGVISRDSRGAIEWLPGLQCGCGNFHPCNCSEAFFVNRIP